MKYYAPQSITKKQLETTLRDGDSEEICRALVDAAFHISDWRWLQNKCLECCQSEDKQVQATAFICLGHVARFHKAMDLDTVLPIVYEYLHKPGLRDAPQDALNDIRQVFPQIPKDN